MKQLIFRLKTTEQEKLYTKLQIKLIKQGKTAQEWFLEQLAKS